MKIFSIISVVVLFLSSCSYNTENKNNKESEKILAAKLYEYTGNYDSLFLKWQATELNTAFVSRELFMNEEFRNSAKAYGIKLFLIYPIFYNPDTLRQNSNLYAVTNKGNRAISDWVHFVCPIDSGYQQFILNDIRKIAATTPPYAFSIDFIRQFFYWEMVKPTTPFDSIEHGCYCKTCLQTFQKQNNISIPENLHTTEAISKWLLTEKKSEWQTWRNENIISMVKQIHETIKTVDSSIKINLHIVPDDKQDSNISFRNIAAQNISELGKYADFLSPMCYSYMLFKEPQWIANVLNNMQKETKTPLLPSIQVSECYRTEKLSVAEFEACCKAAFSVENKGITFFNWEYLQSSPEKSEIWKTVKKEN